MACYASIHPSPMKGEPEILTLPDATLRGRATGFLLGDFERVPNAEAASWRYGQAFYFLCRDGAVRRARVTGAVKTWKRAPGVFRVPAKFGCWEHFRVKNGDDGFAVIEGAEQQIILKEFCGEDICPNATQP